MSNPIHNILNSLTISSHQLTTPPYTEDNRPMGKITIEGKDQAEKALTAYVEEERRMAELHEVEGFIGAMQEATEFDSHAPIHELWDYAEERLEELKTGEGAKTPQFDEVTAHTNYNKGTATKKGTNQ